MSPSSCGPRLDIPLSVLLLLAAGLVHSAHAARRKPPHIVYILADDLGWNDVGWRDPDMRTPNLDRLASEGVILNNQYMQQMCTPSRAALLTGKYPFRMGVQSGVFSALRNNSLPLGLKLLPEHLQELGYTTHMVGKWHLGFCRWEMTPTYRGFDSFYGMYNGHAHYFSHLGHWEGYDMMNNTQTDWSARGVYSTHLFTDRAVDILENHTPAMQDTPLFLYLAYQAVHGPLEVPEYYVTNYCAHVTDETRRVHCAMTAAMDEGIGNVTSALKRLGYDDNLLLVFSSDNGGPVKLGSSNWPLRGSKITLWEGGTRAVSFMHSTTLLTHSYTWNGLMHAVDWYPTLMRVAGHSGKIEGIDGRDLWQEISQNRNSSREEFLYNVDDVKNNSALRFQNWKIIRRKGGSPDGWYNPPAGIPAPEEPSGKYPDYLLFDLQSDPEERTSLHKTETQILEMLKRKLSDYEAQLVPTVEGETISAGKPSKWGGAWTPGWC